MNRVNIDDFAGTIRLHTQLSGGNNPDTMTALSKLILTFLHDPKAILEGYDPKAGHTKMLLPLGYMQAPEGVLDFVVALFVKNGFVCHWKEVREIVGKATFTGENLHATRRYIYFSIPC